MVGAVIGVAGHVCVDLVPEIGPTATVTPGELIEIGPLALRMGGCVANTGTDLADLGAEVRVSAAVGDDELGAFATQRLTSHPRISGTPVVDPNLSTSYSLVLEPAGVDRTFWHHVGANAAFDGSSVEVEGLDILHIGYPTLLPALFANGGEALVALLERARAAGLTTSIDLAVVDPAAAAGTADWESILRRVMPLTDVISPSIDDLSSALGVSAVRTAEEAATLLIDWGAAVVAVSSGSRGLQLMTASAERLRHGGRVLASLGDDWAGIDARFAPAPIGNRATTNGAGDAATAGLLFALAAGFTPEQAGTLATVGAAVIIRGEPTTPERIAVLWPEFARLTERMRARDAIAPSLSGTVSMPDSVSASPRRPIVLPANQPEARFYRGGSRIAEFRGVPASGTHVPEDWVASTTSVRGDERFGPTRLPDGVLLADAIDADPTGWLGDEHLAAFGSDPKLLVKLLDAGQRLPVHAHPDGAFASRHLGTRHGKAEAWHLHTPGVVYLGLKEPVSTERLRELVDAQRVEELLGLLHEVAVHPGDRVYVPPGVLHAIGEGILLTEVQEPEDLSILLEWRDFDLDGAADGHLGLGFDVALGAVETRRRTEEEIAELVVRADESAAGLPGGAGPYFRLERVDGADGRLLEPGFAVVIGLDGEVDLVAADGERTRVARGTTVVVPAGAGELLVEGSGGALVARPPRLDRAG